jgi:putative addiction module component (TIGR02574 family)
MAKRFDVKRLSPEERIELAEELWDSLVEEDIVLTPEQLEELERRRARLERDGPRGRPWRDVLGEIEKRGA